MNPKLLVILAFLVSNAYLEAQTYHAGGTIAADESWLATGNPHIITGNITVLDGVTLTIGEGSSIQFDDLYFLEIQGSLQASGTSSNPVVFTSNKSVPAKGDWGYLYFNSAETSLLDYFELYYGGGITVPSDITTCGILVTACGTNVSITNSMISDIAGYGIINSQISPTNISNTTIVNCDAYPIWSEANGVKNITGTLTLTGNNPDEIWVNGGGLDLPEDGISTGTWLNHGYPYVIGGAQIEVDGILTIEPGVIIKFTYGNFIRVNGGSGTLIAQGLPESHIVFTSNFDAPGEIYWRRIWFRNTSGESIMEYCDIDYAGNNGSPGVLIENSNLTLSHCTIDNCLGRGVEDAQAGNGVIINDCSITNCGDWPIRTFANKVKDITGNMLISGNAIDMIYIKFWVFGTGTWLNHGVPYLVNGQLLQTNGTTLTIEAGVELRFNTSSGISIPGQLVAVGTEAEPILFTSAQDVPAPGDWGQLSFGGCDPGTVMDHCIVSYGGGSGTPTSNISVANCGTNLSISNSVIQNSDGYGIFITDFSSPTLVRNQIINNQSVGVFVQGSSSPIFGIDETEWNDIYGNGDYELRIHLADVDARYIYWGTSSCGQVSDKILMFGAGVATYDPWLTADHEIQTYSSLTTWTGANSSNWNDDGNWDNNYPCPQVDAAIPATVSSMNWPVRSGPLEIGDDCNSLAMEGSSQLTVNGDLTVQAGKDLSILADASIAVVGSFYNLGSFDPGTGSVTIQGTSSQIIAGNTPTTLHNLVADVSDGGILTLETDVLIEGDLTLKPATSFTNGAGHSLTILGSAFFESDNTGNASFLDYGSTSFASDPQVELYLTGNSWHYVSSPISNAQSGAFLGYYLKTFNEPTDNWNPSITAIDTPLDPMKGYAAWVPVNPATIVFPGVLGSGDYSINVSCRSYDPLSEDGGWNLVGNPYPSYLDWNSPALAKNNIDNTIYFFKGNGGEGYEYNYHYYVGPDGDIPEIGIGDATSDIPPMQGFFVHASSDGSFGAGNSARIHGSQEYYKGKDTKEVPVVRLKVSNSEGFDDETIIRFYSKATPEYDGKYDAFKLSGLGYPLLYSVTQGETELAVNTLPGYDEKTCVKLGFIPDQNGSFSVEWINQEHSKSIKELYLEDIFNNTIQNLSEEPIYQFSAGESDSPARFLLHFGASQDPGNLESNPEPFSVFSYGSEVYIKKNITGVPGAHAGVYNLLGQLIRQVELNGSPINKINMGDSSGNFIVRISWETGTVSGKVFIP